MIRKIQTLVCIVMVTVGLTLGVMALNAKPALAQANCPPNYPCAPMIGCIMPDTGRCSASCGAPNKCYFKLGYCEEYPYTTSCWYYSCVPSGWCVNPN